MKKKEILKELKTLIEELEQRGSDAELEAKNINKEFDESKPNAIAQATMIGWHEGKYSGMSTAASSLKSLYSKIN